MRSYRHERMAELRKDFRVKHVLAGKAVVPFVKAKTPIGTPESTGDPDYEITRRLWKSIDSEPAEDHVDIGVKAGEVENKKGTRYAPFVHQGTHDYAHGYGGWEEDEARAFDSLRDTGDGPGPLRGMRARPFLVNGLLDARPALIAIYGKPIN